MKWRRLFLGTLIVVNTIMFGLHLIVWENTMQAVVALMTCIACWLGLYIISVTERLSSHNGDDMRSKKFEEKDNDND